MGDTATNRHDRAHEADAEGVLTTPRFNSITRNLPPPVTARSSTAPVEAAAVTWRVIIVDDFRSITMNTTPWPLPSTRAGRAGLQPAQLKYASRPSSRLGSGT
jgi:hypothetical protein